MEFNFEMETLELALWRAGMEYGDDGEVQFVDTPWAMGAEECGD